MVVSVGIVVLLAWVTAVLAILCLQAWRWAMAGLVCSMVALIVAPAKDVITVTIVGTLYFLFFLGGIRFERRRSIAAK